MIHIFRIALAFLVITFGASAIAQTTWWVDDNCGSKPDGSEAKPFCTIRDGINAAALSGDTVRVKPGLYQHANDRNILVANGSGEHKAVTIECDATDHSCVIDPQLLGRVFRFESQSGAPAKVIGFTIKRGKTTSAGDPHGGAMKVVNASPEITNNIFEDCLVGFSFGWGGAVYAEGSGSAPLFSNNTFRRNGAQNGGAVFTDGGVFPSFNNDDFIDHTQVGSNGGAVYVTGRATFHDCDFTGNSVPGRGGAVWIGGDATESIVEDCTFTLNVAESTSYENKGGGIYQDGGNVTVRRGVFTANRAEEPGGPENNGGGAINLSGGILTLDECEFASNATTAKGGAVLATGGQVTARACVFEGNTAGRGAGAALDNAGGTYGLPSFD